MRIISPSTVSTDQTPNPSWLCLHPGQRVLYAVNEVWGGREGSGAAFRINTSGGALQPLAVRGSGGRGPCHLTLSPDARLLACANYAGGSVVLLLVAPTATCSRRQRCNSTPAAARIRSGRRRHTRTPWIFRLMAAI